MQSLRDEDFLSLWSESLTDLWNGVGRIWADRASGPLEGPMMEERKARRVLSPHERLCYQIQSHPSHLHQDPEGFAMVVEEHSAFHRRSGPLGNDPVSVNWTHSVCLDLLDRRAAASICSRRTRILSFPCNLAGRLGLFLSLVPRQAGSDGVGLYFPGMNSQRLSRKDFQTAFLGPPRISAVSPHDS